MAKEESKKTVWIIAGIIVAILLLVIFTSAIQETYEVQIPYTATETYTEQIATKNCDYENQCTCLHKGFLGLGACDSCRCIMEKDVTKYKTEQKTRYKNRIFNYEQTFFWGY